MKILLTGPFGTIGSRVLARLVREGHEVTCFDLDTPQNREKAEGLPPGARVVYGDVTDPEAVSAAVRGSDAVVHLAALIPPMSEQNPELAARVNVGGTKNVLAAIEREAPSARLVFPSSVSVHGYSAGREPPVRVDTPLDGRDNYARQKVECEGLVRESGVRWVILRIGACVGPDDLQKDGGGAESMAMTFSMNPENRIEYLHPEDAAVAIERACVREEALGKVLFLGSGEGSRLTWREFVSTVPRAMGLGELPAEWFGDEPYYTDWMDTEEAEGILGFQRHGYEAYREALEKKYRLRRALLGLIRPLARRGLQKQIAAAKARGA